jgi:26S proteasome regulatory subunit T5
MDVDVEIPDEILNANSSEIISRNHAINNELKILKSEITILQQEIKQMKERLKDNLEKIKLNKQLPYLVGHVIEVR